LGRGSTKRVAAGIGRRLQRPSWQSALLKIVKKVAAFRKAQAIQKRAAEKQLDDRQKKEGFAR
jgi:hypothetical protein